MYNTIKNPFYTSIFGGIIMWLILFIITPAYVVNPFSFTTFIYIFLSYVSLLAGYALFPKAQQKTAVFTITKKQLYVLVFFIYACFCIRYIDLFQYRGLQLNNTIALNKKLAANTQHSFLFLFAAMIKQLFFIPLILFFANKTQDKKLLVASLLLFAMPFAEGFLRGSRNTFFFSIIMLLFILIYFKKLTFSKKQLIGLIGLCVILLFFTITLFNKRENVTSKKEAEQIAKSAVYTHFFKTKPKAIAYISSIKNASLHTLGLAGLQFGQYYVHGVFEFDNLVKHYQKTPLKLQKGHYTFSNITKFTNNYNITKIDENKVAEAHPRGYTFITFFGGIYLDFWWYGLLFFFAYGMVQKYLQNQTNNNEFIIIPIQLFFLFTNFFMLTFNYIKGNGTYIIIIGIFAVCILELKKLLTQTK